MIWRVVYSHAPKDTKLRDRLGTHLEPLVRKKKISTWHEGNILAGTDRVAAISERLNSAHLILLLLSDEYLASDYCFGAEIEHAFARLKRGEVRMVPILLKPCMWRESPFSELQILPRDGKPVNSASSVDAALSAVAEEVREIVSQPIPRSDAPAEPVSGVTTRDSSLTLVARQLRSYARVYERTRQRLKSSPERTDRMEQIVARMRMLAPAASPLLHDLANSPSPGDRLAAIAILQFFAAEELFPFLLRMVQSDQPFIVYHALLAIHFAVNASEPHVYPELSRLLQDAGLALDKNDVPATTDRRRALAGAKAELQALHDLFSGVSVKADRDVRTR